MVRTAYPTWLCMRLVSRCRNHYPKWLVIDEQTPYHHEKYKYVHVIYTFFLILLDTYLGVYLTLCVLNHAAERSQQGRYGRCCPMP
jgi:hypothetical protein